MRLRKLIAAACMTVTMMSLAAHAVTPWESGLEPTAGQTTPTFPAKGDLELARTVSLTFDGTKRSYLIEAPTGRKHLPIIVLLHGGTSSAEGVWRQTSLPTLARSEGFILVAPDAVNKHWNDGRGTGLDGATSSANDVGFLKQVIADVIAQNDGNPQAVFMVGVSNGGSMTMHFACEAGNSLRAASYVVSDMLEAEQTHCTAPPMPWLAMNGTSDPIMPFDGVKAGTVRFGNARPALLSADATFEFWAGRDHCGPFASKLTLPHRNADDPTSAEVRTCNGLNGLPSVQYVFHGGGHTWPNVHYGALIKSFFGDPNQDVDAGQAIWLFFQQTL